MAKSSYDLSLAELLKSEGGYSNHPNDSGGPTNFGITIGDYRRYLKNNAMAEDVSLMNISEAKTIYKSKYWNALRCDDLPAGVDFAVFDFGVNSGISRSAKYLQSILRIKEDGVIGPVTIMAAERWDANKLITSLFDARLAYLKKAKNAKTGAPLWPSFGKGWSDRIASGRKLARALATPAPLPPVKPARRPWWALWRWNPK